MRFSSKKDWWLMLMIWIPLIYLLFISLYLLVFENDTWGQVAFGIAILLLGALLGWMVWRTEYVIREDVLLVRTGMLKWTIDIQAIQSVKSTRNPLSSPALSLDRLEIQYMKGKVGHIILISPNDKEQFVKLLRERNYRITVQL